MKRLLLALLLCLPVWADGIDDATVYVPVTIPAAKVTEAILFVYVPASALPTAFHDELHSTAKNVRVTNSDGTTEYPIFIASYDDATDTGAFFFLATGMSASVDTTFRFYGGSPTAEMYAASDTYGRNAVFAGYSALWVFNSLTDLTGNGYNLTNNGAASGTTGPFEGTQAYTFTRSESDYLSHAGSPITGHAAVSLEVIVRSSDNSNLQGVFNISDNSGTGGRTLQMRGQDGDTTRFALNSNVSSPVAVTATGTYTANTWHHLAGTYAGGGGTFATYRDGSNATSSSYGSTPTTTMNTIIFGRLANSTEYLSGDLVFGAISPSVRSANFISTSHTMWTDPTFLDVGTAVSLGGDCTSGSTGWSLFGDVDQTADGGDVAWVNLSNIGVDDSNATTAPDMEDEEESYTLLLLDPVFGEAIPVDAEISAVHFRIRRSTTAGGGFQIVDDVIQAVQEGVLAGDNLAEVDQWGSVATVEYGGNLLGATWSPSLDWATSGFAVRVVAEGPPMTSATASAFFAEMKVDWTCGEGPRPLGFFELLR